MTRLVIHDIDIGQWTEDLRKILVKNVTNQKWRVKKIDLHCVFHVRKNNTIEYLFQFHAEETKKILLPL